MARRKLTLLLLVLGFVPGCPAASTSQGGGTQVEVLRESGPTEARPTGAAQTTRTETGPELPAGLAADVKAYLLAVHQLVEREWREGVLARASAALPPSHPANQRQLVAEVAVSLDFDGQPSGARVARSSGYRAFDESALAVMRLARKLPPLPPSIGEGVTTLIWRFHRDERASSPAHARLDVKPPGPEEAMRRALARGQLDRARQLLRSSAGNPAVLELVAGAGLAASQAPVRRLALQLASPTQLQAVIPSSLRDAARWRLLLAALAARKNTRQLTALLDRAAAPGTEAARLIDLLDALAWLEAPVASPLLVKLLARPEPAVVIAAANLARRADVLEAPLARWKSAPQTAGPLAVRVRALGESATADELIRHTLAGPDALPTLDAIARHMVKAYDAELEALVRSSKTGPAVRERAIEVLAVRHPSIGALYVALRDIHPAVQIAAARALARSRGNKVAISNRLADLAARTRGDVQTEMLAALAHIGDERFRDDTLRRVKQLDPARQVVIAEALGSYGEKAIAVLAKMLAQPSPALRAAAARGLARIGSERAKRLLASLPQSPPRPSPSPLQQLLEDAVAQGSARP